MNQFLISSAIAFALTSTQLAADPIGDQGAMAGLRMAQAEQIWLAQGNSGKARGNDKALKKGRGNVGNDNPGRARGRPHHAGGPKVKANSAVDGPVSHGKGKGAKGGPRFNAAERDELSRRILATPAPAGRDMKRVVGGAGLGLITPQLLVADIPEDELIAYRNCSPGLAKKDPPCVPPGLASQGVTYEEWTSYGQDDYDTIWRERREEWLSAEVEAEVEPDPEALLLQSDQIAALFDLDPAPEGQRYGLIDGMPVLLDHEDHDALLLVNQMAQPPEGVAGTPVSPTAALTQDELVSLYRLPEPGVNENYAVVNGQLVQLNDSNYELLQMIRVARAVL